MGWMVVPVVEVVPVMNVMVVMDVVWMRAPVDHDILLRMVRQMRLREVWLVGGEGPGGLGLLEVIESLF